MADPRQLVELYRSKGVLVDTNLMLLYCIGSFDPKRVATFKRTAQYSIEDFQLLEWLLSLFSTVVTTPNVLTEVNSLSGQLGEPAKRAYLVTFAQNARSFLEEYVPSAEAVKDALFEKVGLTDAAIAVSAAKKYLVLTDDLKLWQILARRGVDALNFNHIRMTTW